MEGFTRECYPSRMRVLTTSFYSRVIVCALCRLAIKNKIYLTIALKLATAVICDTV